MKYRVRFTVEKVWKIIVELSSATVAIGFEDGNLEPRQENLFLVRLDTMSRHPSGV